MFLIVGLKLSRFRVLTLVKLSMLCMKIDVLFAFDDDMDGSRREDVFLQTSRNASPSW